MKSLFWSFVMFFLVTVVPCFARGGGGGGGSRNRGHMPTLPVQSESTVDEFVHWSIHLILDLGMYLIVAAFWLAVVLAICWIVRAIWRMIKSR